MSLLEQRLEQNVLWLTLNRPERKNAISPDLRQELLSALDRAREDDEVRCVLMTGAGDAFCAGVDLSKSKVTEKAAEEPKQEKRPQKADLRATREAMKKGMQKVIRSIWELDKPVVAAVNGVAAGGGAQLALCCDLILAAESAKFIQIFAKRGLAVDSGGGWLLPRLVGLARAKELVFFADPLKAEDAERIGLINRAVPDGDLPKVAGEWAERLAKSATRAIGASKTLLNHAFESDLTTGFEEEATAQAFVSQTFDFTEGVRAFLEKRDTEFRGR
ncbi:MAG: enoyl-CoA hydratase/isomerase family protein [Actinomycetota bacterium]|nr:enoyl-CoA hydratase/isomerase family protein [Actinomycetota bacterium]